MKVSIVTLGCRVNQAESDEMGALLGARGVRIVDLADRPDFCIVNTCTVTAESDQNSRQFIRRAARTGAKVIVTGCYAQLMKAEAASLEGVAAVFDNTSKDKIVRSIAPGDPAYPVRWSGRSRPYIKVQDGCNFRCSYCAVPLARGRSRSVQIEDVVRRAVELEKTGYGEIVLTGIHLGTYGHDLEPRIGLGELLRRILEETRSCRIRLSSIEVTEIDEVILDMMKSGRICSHLHIPLQSGSSRILGIMCRNYNVERFRETVCDVLRRHPGIAIGTDVMVGFPGETEEDFSESLALITEIPFSYLHVFPYSRRKDTPAAAMSGQVPRKTVRERLAILKRVDMEKRLSYMSAQAGKTLEIIIEEQNKGGRIMGTSGNFLKVLVSSGVLKRGTKAAVRVTGIRDGHLEAELT